LEEIMSRRFSLLVLALVVSGCGGAKRAAEQAVAAADSAIAAVSGEAERVAPELLQPLVAAVTDAKASIGAGQYEAATAAVSDIPARAADVSKTVEQLKKDFAADFATLSEAMPRNLEAIKQKLARPPRSLSRERLADLQKAYDEGMVEWPAVTQEFQSGAVGSAMAKAFGLKAKVSEAMVALGLSADEKAWGNLITQPK
jgi:hypothetical protein